MCGIGGFVDFDRDARRGGPVLSAMDRRLRPRGPDASGVYTDPDAALVHRRLIVIDPEAAGIQGLSERGLPRAEPDLLSIQGFRLLLSSRCFHRRT